MNNLTDYPLLVFALALFGLWLSARIGSSFLKRQRKLEEDVREDFGVILTATLTLLGLIIGFSFSMAISRYDQRKNYEEAEANAIGTEYLRADLLPEADAARVRRCSANISISASCSIGLRDKQQLRRSMLKLLNCKASCGLRSGLRLQRSRHPWSHWPFGA
jgi:hypothetical protein